MRCAKPSTKNKQNAAQSMEASSSRGYLSLAGKWWDPNPPRDLQTERGAKNMAEWGKKQQKKTKTNMNDGQERSHEWNLYQMIQAKWPFDSRWLEVAFSPLKGSLNHPQKVRIARYLLFKNYIGDFVMFGGSLFLGSVLFSTCRWDEMEGKLSKWRKDDGASEPCKIPWK